MKNDIKNIFNSIMASSMEEMVYTFKNSNMTPEEIAERIKDLHEIIREGIRITALSAGDKEMSDKIGKANQIIIENRIAEFKKAVANGTQEEFLSKMPWTDKVSLKVNIKFSSTEKPLPQEEQRYMDIIEKSIDEDINKEAWSQGFSSVEKWREYNAKVAASKRSSSEGSNIKNYVGTVEPRIR